MTAMVSLEAGGAAMRTLPCNYDAERALLGAILMNKNAFDRVATFMRPEYFADPVNARIYLACSKLIDMGHQANPVTLKPYLENDDLIKTAGGIKYIATLAASAVTFVNAPDYAKMILDLYLRRCLIEGAMAIADQAYDMNIDEVGNAQDIIESGISGLAEMLENTASSTGEMVSISDVIEDAIKRQEAVDRGEITGVSTGLPALDGVMGILQPGNLTVIAGRPSMGKSALAQVILYHVAHFFAAEAKAAGKKPQHCVFFSQEMTDAENADRLISAQTNIPAPRKRQTHLTENQWAKLLEFREKMHDLPFMLDSSSRATLGRIRARCRRLQRSGGVGLIVIDYLQIMGTDKSQRSENRTQEIGKLVTGLKDLAKELNCHVIALSQLNRGVEAREDKRPNLSDLRESGEIEQAADNVGFCYRDEYYLERAEPKSRPDESSERFGERITQWESLMAAAEGRAEIIFAKCRHGEVGTANLLFDGPRTWFSDPSMTDSTPGPGEGSRAPPTRPAPIYSQSGHMPDGRPEPPANDAFTLK